jgi:hypothetical protein
MSKQSLKYLPAVVLFLSVNLFGFNSRTDVPLDGYNAFTYDTAQYLFNANLSIIYGSVNDSFYKIKNIVDTSVVHKKWPYFDFSTSLKTETGNALFNWYSNDSHDKRYNENTFSITGAYPGIPITLAYKYRYNDTYSDRFDSLWHDYNFKNKKSMSYYQEGLCREDLILARYQSASMIIEALYNSYSRWGASPLYFTPIFSEGNVLHPSVQYTTNRITLFSKWNIDNRSTYYNLRNPYITTDLASDNGIEMDLEKNITGKLEIAYDNSKNPETAVSLSFIKSESRFRWGLSGTLYSDEHVAAKANGALTLNQNYGCSLSVSRDHLAKERAYDFYVNDWRVQYEPHVVDQTNLYGAISYEDTLLFPVKLAVWFQYCSNPIWESVSFPNNTTYIEQVTLPNTTQMVAGFYGNYFITYKKLKVNISPNLMIPLKTSLMRFKIGSTAQIDFIYSNLKPNPASVSLSLLYKDRSALSYPMNNDINNMQTYISPAYTSVNFNIRIPFITPLINSVLKNTAFIANYGPLRNQEIQRIHEQPKGNLIGPAIYAGFEGMIR